MLITFLTSAVIAAFVSGLVTVLTTERRIAAENVIQERTKWREKIRELSEEYQKLVSIEEDRGRKRRELRETFSLRVNPHDPEDQALLRLICENPIEVSEEFANRVALLLKHDWERGKYEATFLQRCWREPPPRCPFDHYRPGRAHVYRGVPRILTLVDRLRPSMRG
jgi:hypothetical protein